MTVRFSARSLALATATASLLALGATTAHADDTAINRLYAIKPVTVASLRSASAAQPPADEPRIVEGRDFSFRVRLGAMVSPRTKFVGGVDFTFAGLTPQLTSRVDVDAIVSANFGGVTTIVPVTFSQIYGARLANNNTRIYGGVGVGPYFGNVTRFGGKLFVGADFTNRTSGEVGVHFAGAGDPLVTLQVRFGL